MIGLLVGSSLERAVSLGFYGVGSFFLVVGFFIGNRGPARLRSETAGFSILPLFGERRVRWATAEEHEETINMSAVWVALGFVVIVIAIAVDSRHELF